MNKKSLEVFLKATTMSSSGWRRIYNSQQNPYSMKKTLDDDLTFFTAIAFEVIGGYFKKRKSFHPSIVIARDSRPTGKAIIEVLHQVLKTKKIRFWDMGIAAIPQCAILVKTNPKLAGFIYITASHNPPGYNGIKIGNQYGKVITENTNQKLISQFKKKFYTSVLFPYLKPHPLKKNIEIGFDATEAYRASLLKNLGYRQPPVHSCFEKMVTHISQGSHSIACDFNGSARINSIDKDFITKLGIHFLSINNKLGKFEHEIVPEQKSLDPLKKQIAGIKWQKHNILFGYVVDCDGDRGNIVVNRSNLKGKPNSNLKAYAPDAQTTFALTVLAELCYLQAFFPKQLSKTIIVANDPTSLRIDILAKKFGVSVERAEVGEANVVGLAHKLRRQGQHTPVMGEGSNGGSIIYPSVMRDPLSTVTSLIKLLFMDNGIKSLREIALKKLGCPQSLKKIPVQFFLDAIIPFINTAYSTSVFEPSTLIKTDYSSQKNFKKIYEDLWLKEWTKQKKSFSSWGISSYKIINYEGVDTHIGSGNRHGLEDGGHKVSFYNGGKKETGFIWFRFSKTEPVIRLSAEHMSSSIQKKLFILQYKLLTTVAYIDKKTNL